MLPEIKKLPIVLNIDVEPDDVQIQRHRKDPWHGFEAVSRVLTDLRPRLEDLTGQPVHFNWFFRMDPQVGETYGNPAWVVQEYDRAVSSFIEAGDEMGLHVHCFRWDDKAQHWISDHATQDWVEYCLSYAYAAFQSVFNRGCKSQRFGARWVNQKSMNFAEDLGTEFDLTLEPGVEAEPSEAYAHFRSNTGYPDFSKVPRMIYTPNRNNYLLPDALGSRNFYTIPLTDVEFQAKFGRTERFYNQMFHPERLRKIDRLLYLDGNARYFNNSLRILLDQRSPEYFALDFRTHLGSDPEKMQNIVNNLLTLVNHPDLEGCQFMTPQELVHGVAKQAEDPLPGVSA